MSRALDRPLSPHGPLNTEAGQDFLPRLIGRLGQIDVVTILQVVEPADADLSFRIEFTKARRREKANRADFEPVTVTLSEDALERSCRAAAARSPQSRLRCRADDTGAGHAAGAGGSAFPAFPSRPSGTGNRIC